MGNRVIEDFNRIREERLRIVEDELASIPDHWMDSFESVGEEVLRYIRRERGVHRRRGRRLMRLGEFRNCFVYGLGTHGVPHRSDGGPAVIRIGASILRIEWWQDGKRHRDDDLPAVMDEFGNQTWCWRGKEHREGKPSHIEKAGLRYQLNGLMHREDGPAKVMNTNLWWYRDGHLHRDDGPATISSGGAEWYLDGRRGRSHTDSPSGLYADGTRIWFDHATRRKRREHRGDGTVVIFDDAGGTPLYSGRMFETSGTLIYFSRIGGNGVPEPHRIDGPAITHIDGTREWYREGKLHREDGPAVERADGHREWHVDGKRINGNILRSEVTQEVLLRLATEGKDYERDWALTHPDMTEEMRVFASLATAIPA